MFIGITLELEDGQESRIWFTQTTDSGAIAHCEASNDTRTRTVCSKLFQVLPVPIPQSVQDEYDITVRQEPVGQVPLDGKPF